MAPAETRAPAQRRVAKRRTQQVVQRLVTGRHDEAAADLLVDLGVDAKRIQVVGYGVDFPVAENASARGRAQNRRVEIVFSDERGQLGAER